MPPFASALRRWISPKSRGERAVGNPGAIAGRPATPRFMIEALEDRTVLSPATALDDYIAKPEPVFQSTLVAQTSGPGFSTYVLSVLSQTWRDSSEVHRTTWQHYVTIVVPTLLEKHTAILLINGGSNSGQIPAFDSRVAEVSIASRAIGVDVRTIPNQPLIFSDETRTRSEDEIIAYSYDKYLQGGDEEWPVLLAMVKGVVRSMDAVQAFVPQVRPGFSVDDFLVTGFSKRGWTTWLTAAADPRVKAIAPGVIDMLNAEESIRHHFESYGFFSRAIEDYDDLNIFGQFGTLRGEELLRIVDPFQYKDRLATIPKFVLNSAGDEFFLPDSSQFYFDELLGPKWLRYIPNTGHGMGNGREALNSVLTYALALLNDVALPEYSWTVDEFGVLRAQTSDPRVQGVRLWQVTNPERRDFRKPILDSLDLQWTSTLLTPTGGVYIGDVATPATGATAYLVEFTFNSGFVYDGQAVPFKFTTEVRVKTNLPPLRENFGTAPDSYGTTLANDGARHTIIAGYRLGNRIAAQYDGQPNAQAVRTGYVEYNDIDGVAFNTTINPGTMAAVTVVVDRWVGDIGKLNAWLDFNGDGDFDANEQIFDDLQLLVGANELAFAVPLWATANITTYARFRYSSQTGLGPTGAAIDGEVEDYRVTVGAALLDFGDANSPFPTLLANDGARHQLAGGLFLGSKIDLEADGVPTNSANGDDLAGEDDEDGVAVVGLWIPGQTTRLTITASAAGYLSGWIDWNADGDWNDPGEKIFSDQLLSAGANSFDQWVPVSAVPGTTAYARFRFSSQTGLAPTGLAPDGEVEDYAFQIANEAALATAFVDDDSVVAAFGSPAAAKFTVRLAAASTQFVTVRYQTADVTALAGRDYVAASGELFFAPGTTSIVVSVPILTSLRFAPTRQFVLNLSQPTNGRIGDGQGLATIVSGNSPVLHYVDQAFRSFLGRELSDSDRSFWLNAFQSGLNYETFLIVVLSSQEYFIKAGGSNAAFVAKLYRDLLDRPATSAETTQRLGQLAAGASRGQVANALIASSEFTAMAQVKPVLEGLFLDILHRPARFSDIWFWAKLMKSGLPLSAVASSFTGSAERQNLVAQSYFRQYLGRSLSASDLAFWRSVWGAIGGSQGLLGIVLSSNEYYQKQGGTDDSFVNSLVASQLGRLTSQTEADFWIADIAARGRGAVVAQFLAGPGYRLRAIDDWSNLYLGKPAGPTLQSTLIQLWSGGATAEQVQSSLVSSTDYRQRSQTRLGLSVVTPAASLASTVRSRPQSAAALTPGSVDEFFAQ